MESLCKDLYRERLTRWRWPISGRAGGLGARQRRTSCFLSFLEKDLYRCVERTRMRQRK